MCILLQPLFAASAWNRDHTWPVQYPGERQLCRCTALFARQFLYAIGNCDILRKVFTLEAWIVAAPVVRCQVVEFADAPGQKATAQRTVGHQSDAKFVQRRREFVLGFAAPQGVFRLYGSDGMDGVSAAEGCSRDLGQAQMP